MCGIAGFIGRTPPSEGAIQRTLDAMRNRGPDHRAHQSARIADDVHVALLHSRLAILDLDARSHQPFTIGDTTIVFNGEIYNFVELRRDLEKQGVEFRTTSDTEVLLHCYRRHGERCVDLFEGMWSFAILDRRRGRLLLSRDRFAEKPLYTLETSEGLYFGSETKFLRTLSERQLAVNRNHLLRYLVHGYKALYKTEETFFEGVRELRGGENLFVDFSHRQRRERYWQPELVPNPAMSLGEAIEGAREHLLESVRIRLRSDVPLAFCLSGGVDSASLVSIAAKCFGAELETFSIIDDDERYNEEDNVLATVRDTGCRHNLLKIPREDALPRLRRLIEYHDAPVATITYYVHSLILESLASKGYRVSFSGTSADELFTGYYDHFLLHLDEMRARSDYSDYREDWQSHIAPFVRNPVLRNPDLYHDTPDYRDHVFDASDEWRRYLRVPFDEPFSEQRFCAERLRNRMLNELFYEATPVILHEDDLNSMCYSVENRSPYLDRRLFEFAFSIPSQHLIRHGYGKYVLREAMKGILNDEVRLDRRKKGFNAAIHSMIDFGDPETRAYLLDDRAEVFELLRRDSLEKLFSQEPAPNHLSKFLFSFINARIFLELHG